MKVVILCGGEGARLFPLSRESFPKQFIKIGKESFLEKTYKRAQKLAKKDDIFISTNERYVFLVKDILGNNVNIITEPDMKNTAPAMLYSIKWITEEDKKSLNDVMVFLPSDHEIKPISSFVNDIKRAVRLAENGFIVLLGINPTKPETGYGYIKKGKPLTDGFLAEEFKEKPSFKEAEEFLRSGEYLWNSGIYIAKASLILEELKNVSEELFPFIEYSREKLKEHFKNLPSISIDHALSERSKKLALLPASFQWSDIGSWDSLYELYPKEKDSNVILGNVASYYSKDSMILGNERIIVTLGIENTIVVDTPDVVLVAKRGETQKIKEIVKDLKSLGKKEAVEHTVSFRPWGSYEVLLTGERFKVKRVKIKPQKRLSLQLHHHRAEHWIVVKGTAKVTIGDKTFYLHENESTYVPKSTLHRIENVGKIPLEIIEIQTGEYVEEDDIIRVEDDWQRD